MGRRAVLLGLGTVAVAAATTGGVVWWREARPQSSGRGPSPSTGASSTTPEAVSPPPAVGQELAIAMESAISVRPMADMTFEGGLTQSNFHATGHGQTRFRPEAGYSAGSCDFAMKVTGPDVDAIDVVVLSADGADGLYINGKRLAEDAEHDARGYIDMITIMSGLGVILDLLGHTPQVSGAARRYSGGLDAGSAPQPIKERLAEPANWKLSRLKGTRISWNIELDTANRPKSFTLSWRVPVGGEELASTYATTFDRWRQGDVRAPA
ncbi:hypothetical protein [Nonomuraea sp. NPDC049400]|uniref:hypothetical protein n=1 Tax=Nonomuraea sp. NPDC049400 TaxID=3364352 RepID=UPI0037B9F563